MYYHFAFVVQTKIDKIDLYGHSKNRRHSESLKSKWKWKIMNGKIHKSIIQQVVSINLKGLIGLSVTAGLM